MRLFKEIKNNTIVMENIKCKMCNIIDCLIDKDCHGCYIYYELNNPIVLKDFEEGSIIKVKKKTIPCINCNDVNIILTADNQYICLSCRCINGYKFDECIKVEYYRKMYYNRKYHLEKFIKKYQNYENFERMKVIVLFNKIVNEVLGLNLKRKRLFKFNLIIQSF